MLYTATTKKGLRSLINPFYELLLSFRLHNFGSMSLHTNIVWLALFATAVAAVDDQARLFSWTTNTEQASQFNHQYQIESNYGNANFNNQNDTAAFTAEDLIETILASNRQGRNLDGFDEVYSDPTVQDALQKGDDTEARNLIKDKLCTLGLMQCDQTDSVDHKNAYLRPSELIYAQPPPGAAIYRPHNRPQQAPHPQPGKIIYGAPRPMPPGIINGNKFGPRKYQWDANTFFFRNTEIISINLIFQNCSAKSWLRTIRII